ncbi:hypothetical protein [Namhaeicola litoreus]|uniref:Uncharacterized protein n=1 Tax=Namhaeicola litoreus TaxID=1052145 RepID=A0ABW3Y2C8_9FLAO
MSTQIYGQKTMLLNEDLKNNSQEFPIKRKGLSNIIKIKFGPYSTDNVKLGISTTQSGNLFKSDVKTSSKNNYSYSLIDEGGNTINAEVTEKGELELDDKKSFFYRLVTNVDIQVNDNFNIHIGEIPTYEIVKNLNQTVANFENTNDNEGWQCIIVTPMDAGMEDYYFGGLITYDNKEISILEVSKNEKNETYSILGISFPILYGYEFFQNGKIIAALQNYPLNKQKVWLHHDLDEKSKLVIASIIPVLINTNINNMSTLD